MKQKVEFKKLYDDVALPKYEHEGDSGMDVFSRTDETLACGETKLFPLGFKVSVPKGYEIQVRSKSGLALKKQIVTLNSPGTIDSNFRGECCVILHNAAQKICGYSYPCYAKDIRTVKIEKGQKIAQIVLCPVSECEWSEVDELDETSRGEGGFGSTGDGKE